MLKGLVMGLMGMQMCGWYMRVPSSVSGELRGRRSTVDSSIYYSEGYTVGGDTVYAAWLRPYFPELVSAGCDSVYLCIDQL